MTASEGWIPYRPGGESEDELRGEIVHVAVDAEIEEEIVDGLPVLAEVRELAPAARIAVIPAVQAAAAAATGFVAGAATVALARRAALRRVERAFPAGRPGGLLPARGTRTFLVHVRVLGRPGE